MTPSLWFVQPVHGRVGLARLCMEQRRRMMDELAGRGIDANMIVVGNDANVATARELGFHALERPNELGRKVNEGFEWACREGGADFVTYIGSDDWALASWFATLPPVDRVKTSAHIAFVGPLVAPTLRVRTVPGSVGNAPWIIPRALLERVGFRPSVDGRRQGIDGSIRNSLARALSPRRGRWEFASAAEWRRANREGDSGRIFLHEHGDELRCVDFKGSKEQITSYSAAMGRPRWVIHDEPDPWPTLATRYPADLCERMERLYADRRLDA